MANAAYPKSNIGRNNLNQLKTMAIGNRRNIGKIEEK